MINKRLAGEIYDNRYKLWAVASAVFNTAFAIINAYLLSLVITEVFLQKAPLSHILDKLYLLVGNAALKALFGIAADYHIKAYSEELKESLRKKAFDTLLNANPLTIKKTRTGDIVNLLGSGMDMITPYYAQYLPQFVSAVLTPFLILITAAFVDKLSMLIMLITYPIIPIFMILIGGKSKELNEKQWGKLNLLSSHFIDMLQGISTLKMFGRSKRQEEKVFEVSESFRKATMGVLKVSFLSALVLETAATISAAMIAVNLGLHLVYGSITFEKAFFLLVLAPEFYLPMRQLGMKFHASLNGEVAIDKLNEFKERLLQQEKNGELELMQGGALSIDVVNLSCSQGGKDVLKEISFSIEKGQKVALVGKSGSGKSTLLNILSGLLPIEAGKVLVNGMDLSDIDRSSYLKSIGVMSQQNHLFYRSIRDNVLLGLEQPSSSKFERICRQTKVQEFAAQFPEGMETTVGQGAAAELSGGEKQRIAAARALVKAAELVILDEPTSALDSETEEMLMNFIEEQLKDKTVVIAAHRLNTVQKADKILVLEEGRIIEAGSHHELLEKKGFYFNMVRAMEEAI